MANRRLPYQDIVARYQAGEGTAEIGVAYGVSYKTIWRILRKEGVAMRKYQRSVFTSEQEPAILAKYEEGLSLNQIGKEYGCCLTAVRNVLLKHGVEPRRRGGVVREFSDEERSRMTALHAQGKSQGVIAQEMGCSQSLVSRTLRQMGIESGPLFGEEHPRWKGGRVRLGNGYVGVRVLDDSPFVSMRDKQGYILEHRLVMAQHLGRPLRRVETIHHINGDVQDNRLENLQLRWGKHGRGEAPYCRDCGSSNIGFRELEAEM